jgi:formylglycine-generating enzyme
MGRCLQIFLFSLLICNLVSAQTAKPGMPVQNNNFKIALAHNTMLDMVWINPGTFIMGSPGSEAGRKTDESPQTNVTITNGYWLGKTELTIGQWKAVMGESLREHVIKMLNDETVYDFGGQQKKLREYMNFNKDEAGKIMANENDSLPMYFVSWDDAIDFCKKITAQEKLKENIPEGYEYNLPTEAQWEYACRAGTTSSTFAGELIASDKKYSLLDSVAWYSGNSSINYYGKKSGNSNAGPRNAGEKKTNAYGLIDMPGNIWEWCLDVYIPYPGGSVTDYISNATGISHVNRGGSWGSSANDSRSANRAKNPQPEKSAYRGFRIALCKAR